MQSVVLCYALQDETAARALGCYLEANLDLEVSYGEAVVGPERDLIEATERALSAQIAIVLLSPDSVPNHWRRERWEPVFFSKPYEFETLLAFVLIRDCRFPELLRRYSFFDGSRDLQAAARGVKRWLLRPARKVCPVGELPPEFGGFAAEIVDQPGIADDVSPQIAIQFAKRCAADFEAVYHFDCHGRSLAGLLGDIGYRASLKLPGTVDENAAAVRKWCATHRCLFLFDDVSPQSSELRGQDVDHIHPIIRIASRNFF